MRFSQSTHVLINVFVFGDFDVHRKDWLTYSGEFCYNFSISTNLLNWLTFLLGSLCVILIVLLFWIYFFLLSLVFVLQFALHWEILIMLLTQFPNGNWVFRNWLKIDFSSCSQQGAPFHHIAYNKFLCWMGWCSWSFEICFMGGYL